MIEIGVFSPVRSPSDDLRIGRVTIGFMSSHIVYPLEIPSDRKFMTDAEIRCAVEKLKAHLLYEIEEAFLRWVKEGREVISP